jgi:hypothetical protein
LYEGSSIVTLEAMAHRLAVVATAAGGLPDKVRPGVNGWLVTPGDRSELAAALSGALSDPQRLRAMGSEGARSSNASSRWKRQARHPALRGPVTMRATEGTILSEREWREAAIRARHASPWRLLISAVLLRFWSLSHGVPSRLASTNRRSRIAPRT